MGRVSFQPDWRFWFGYPYIQYIVCKNFACARYILHQATRFVQKNMDKARYRT